jgi:hypothetical protein
MRRWLIAIPLIAALSIGCGTASNGFGPETEDAPKATETEQVSEETLNILKAWAIQGVWGLPTTRGGNNPQSFTQTIVFANNGLLYRVQPEIGQVFGVGTWSVFARGSRLLVQVTSGSIVFSAGMSLEDGEQAEASISLGGVNALILNFDQGALKGTSILFKGQSPIIAGS